MYARCFRVKMENLIEQELAKTDEVLLENFWKMYLNPSQVDNPQPEERSWMGSY